MQLLDTYLVYKFIKQLVTPFDETQAFKLGVIDTNGELLLKKDMRSWSYEQQNAYTLFDRLIFNLKKLIQMVPFGKTKLASFAAALYLLREELSEEGKIVLDKSFMSYLKDQNALEEDYLTEQYLVEEMLDKGTYKLVNTMLDTNGNHIPKGTAVRVSNALKPENRVLGIDVYKVNIVSSNKPIIVSREDIEEM